MDEKTGYYLYQVFELIHAGAEFSHTRFVELSQSISRHQLDENSKRFLLRHHHQQETDDKSGTLTVTNLPIVEGVCLKQIIKSDNLTQRPIGHSELRIQVSIGHFG